MQLPQRAHAALRLARLRRALRLVDRAAREVLERVGALRRRARRLRRRARPSRQPAQMPGARFFPGRAPELRRESAEVRRRAAGADIPQRARHAPRALRTASCARKWRASPHGLARRRRGRRRSRRRRSCRICRRPRSPCSPPRASGPPGLPARPTSACTGCSIASGRSQPKVLFTADGYFYAGKTLDSLEPMAEVLAKLPARRARGGDPLRARPSPSSGGSVPRRRAPAHCAASSVRAGRPLHFAPLPFNHPLYILYSSGTTGVPKCIVHGAGGTLLQHQKEHLLHTDLEAAATGCSTSRPAAG